MKKRKVEGPPTAEKSYGPYPHGIVMLPELLREIRDCSYLLELVLGLKME